MLRTAGREIKHRKEEFILREQQRIREEMARREMEMTNAALAAGPEQGQAVDGTFRFVDGRRPAPPGGRVGRAARPQKIVESLPAVGGTDHGRSRAHSLASWALTTTSWRSASPRQKGFVDCLYQTEKSHVPVPDDPPIVYPDAEVWKELTARRKEKYSATELSRRSPAEKKIEEALKQPTQIEFVETPLKDVVDYLKDLHHIEIQLDSAALKEAGVDESTPVTKNLKGISLRSALKLLLDELQLKYVDPQRSAAHHFADQGRER